MAIPSIPAPVRPVDDAIVDTPWGQWVHDLLNLHPVMQTIVFPFTYSNGGGTRNVVYPEAYPAGWTVAVVAIAPAQVTGNTMVTAAHAAPPSLSQVAIRFSIPSSSTYNGTTAGNVLTVAGWSPSALAGPLWRNGNVALLRDELEQLPAEERALYGPDGLPLTLESPA
jgi:hypothetical protein